MDNNDYKAVAAEAATFAMVTFALNAMKPLVLYLMEPDVAVEEKKALKQNAEILRINFTK